MKIQAYSLKQNSSLLMSRIRLLILWKERDSKKLDVYVAKWVHRSIYTATSTARLQNSNRLILSRITLCAPQFSLRLVEPLFFLYLIFIFFHFVRFCFVSFSFCVGIRKLGFVCKVHFLIIHMFLWILCNTYCLFLRGQTFPITFVWYSK